MPWRCLFPWFSQLSYGVFCRWLLQSSVFWEFHSQEGWHNYDKGKVQSGVGMAPSCLSCHPRQTDSLSNCPEWLICSDQYLFVSCVNTNWKIFKMLNEWEKGCALFSLDGIHSLVKSQEWQSLLTGYRKASERTFFKGNLLLMSNFDCVNCTSGSLFEIWTTWLLEVIQAK